MQSFLAWLLNVFIHTIMVNAPVAAVKTKEAPFFATKRHIFRLAELNAFTA